jgi:phosphatidylinositol alpha-1,6-mannosyltransferase
LVSRLALRALRETFGETSAHALTRIDSAAELGKTIAPPYTACDSGPVVMAAKFLRIATFRRWDAIVLMHVNLVQMLPLIPRRIPTAVFFHGVEVWKPLSRAQRVGLRRVERVLCNSEHTRATAVRHNPEVARLPSALCHLGVEPAAEDCSGAVPDDPPYVLSVGRMDSLERYKGFDELIKVWPRVQERRPDLKLVFVGDGPDRPRLERLASGNQGIEFVGRQTDAARDRLLRGCTAFALPSRGEGFGLVYLEAMRVSRPVLAGNSDAGAEVIVDRVTGRAVDPLDPYQLLDGLLDVTGANADGYGAAGKRRFDERFTYAHFRDRFCGEIRQLES